MVRQGLPFVIEGRAMLETLWATVLSSVGPAPLVPFLPKPSTV
jgi:hypothetical protein